MLHTRTSRRYAKVLFNLARETGRVDDIRRDLIGLRDLMRQSPDLSAFLTNYLVPAERRLEVLRSLFEGKAERPDVPVSDGPRGTEAAETARSHHRFFQRAV